MNTEPHAAAQATPAADRMIRHAETMVRAGRRPTVDSLVAELGGSRTTAQNALQRFWQDCLPRLIATTEATRTNIPPTVQEAAGAFWLFAQKTATEVADVGLQRERTTLDALRDEAQARIAEATERAQAALAELRVATETATAQQGHIRALEEQSAQYRADIEQAHSDLKRVSSECRELHERILSAEVALRECESRADGADAEAYAEKQRHETAAKSWAEERERIEAAHAERLGAAIATERELRTAAERGHAQTIAALRHTYHDAEQRAMVSIDAARSDAAKAAKAAKMWEMRHASSDARLRELERKIRSVKSKNT